MSELPFAAALLDQIKGLIDATCQRLAVTVNAELSML